LTLRPLRDSDPTTVGGYQLEGRLGSGGMGVVYLAVSPTRRRLALKVIRPHLVDDDGFRIRFRREVEVARQVHSAYTAAVVDARVQGAELWLATAYVPGPSLRERVLEQGPLTTAQAWVLGAALAEALQVIHGCGIIHRDLKPSNVLLAPDGPQVVDFGIARAIEATSITEYGVAVGSPGFIAPEVLAGRPVTTAADLFALGCTVLFALTGREPFGDGPPDVIRLRAMTLAPNLAGIDGELGDAIADLLAHDPDARPDAATTVARFTDAAARTSGGRSNAASPPTITIGPPPSYPPAPTYPRPPTYPPLVGVPPATALTVRPSRDQPASGRVRPVPNRRRRAIGLTLAFLLAGGCGYLVTSALRPAGRTSSTAGHKPRATVSGGSTGGPARHPASAHAPSHRTVTFQVPDFLGGNDSYTVVIDNLERNGPFLRLDLTVTCGRGAGCSPSSQFEALNASTDSFDTPSGVELIDTTDDEVDFPVTDAASQPLVSSISTDVQSGQATALWATFKALPASVRHVDVAFPNGGPLVIAVPITVVSSWHPPAPQAPVDRPVTSTNTQGLRLPTARLHLLHAHAGPGGGTRGPAVTYETLAGGTTTDTYRVRPTRVTRDGRLAWLALSITCTGASGQSTCDSTSDFLADPDSGDYDYFDGFELYDATTATAYLPVTVDGGTLSSEATPLTTSSASSLSVGSTEQVWVYFPAPSQPARTLAVDVPSGPRITGVPYRP
jgi:serine/threonine protein kinase